MAATRAAVACHMHGQQEEQRLCRRLALPLLIASSPTRCLLPPCVPQIAAFGQMAEAFKTTAVQQNLCATCGRHFGSHAEQQAFLAKQARGAVHAMHSCMLCMRRCPGWGLACLGAWPHSCAWPLCSILS